MEKQQVLLDTVLPVMRGIAIDCQTQNKAFWPTNLAQALAPPVLSETAAEVKALVEENGVLGMLGVLPRSNLSHTFACTVTDPVSPLQNSRRSNISFSGSHL